MSYFNSFFFHRSERTHSEVHQIKDREDKDKETSQFTHTGLGEAKITGNPSKTESCKFFVKTPITVSDVIAKIIVYLYADRGTVVLSVDAKFRELGDCSKTN